MALSFCAYHAWEERSAPGNWRRALMHLAIGGLICLPAALQIAPPGDSQLNLRFWLDIWTERQWDIIAQAPLKAFVPVAGAFVQPLMIVVSNNLKVSTPQELIAVLKANPGRYNYASSGAIEASTTNCPLPSNTSAEQAA